MSGSFQACYKSRGSNLEDSNQGCKLPPPPLTAHLCGFKGRSFGPGGGVRLCALGGRNDVKALPPP